MNIEDIRKKRDELKLEWIKEGCKEPFYYWLLEKLERELKK